MHKISYNISREGAGGKCPLLPMTAGAYDRMRQRHGVNLPNNSRSFSVVTNIYSSKILLWKTLRRLDKAKKVDNVREHLQDKSHTTSQDSDEWMVEGDQPRRNQQEDIVRWRNRLSIWVSVLCLCWSLSINFISTTAEHLILKKYFARKPLVS